MQHPIVFGSSGFIGSHVQDQLQLAGFAATAAVRAGADTRFLQSIQAPIKTIDFASDAALVAAMRGHDVIYNCIASAKRHEAAQKLRAVEVALTRRLVRAAAEAGARRLVQLSTVQVYGFERPALPITEDYPPAPTYLFNQIALEREQAAAQTAREVGIELVLLRPANVIGARDVHMRPLLRTHGMGFFPLMGRGVQLSAIDARDAGRAMVFVGASPQAANETLLVKGFDTSWLAVKAALDAARGRKAMALTIPPQLAHRFGQLCEMLPYAFEPQLTRFSAAVMATNTLFDDSKIRALGFAPQFDLQEAVAALLRS